MKKVFFILGVLFSLGVFWACSSDDETTEVSVNHETGDKNSETKGKGSKTPAGSINNL